MARINGIGFTIASLLFGIVRSQSACSTAPYAGPSVADGYVALLVATDLEDPRGITFDSEGALLVVEAEKGITALTLDYSDNGCISESSRTMLVEDDTLNHAIQLSGDGTLYASNTRAAFSWSYDSKAQKVTSEPTTLVENMTNTDHVSRTLLLSHAVPGMLIISRGSTENVDPGASEIDTGRSQVKAFNITDLSRPYDFNSEGILLGWGLRNDVGVAEHPVTGGIYTVENSVDEMVRNGEDIHNTNPAEEMNFLGYLNGTNSPNQGANFGYPECFTAWDVSTIPDFNGEVGEQFSIGSSSNDSACATRQAPRIAFHPHMAPLDILFNTDGTAAWVTFHGSWNSEIPVGYKISVVEFENGEPVEPSTSKTAAIDIMSNHDVTSCYDKTCFRPVDLAWDSDGTLFMSSDETGEIWAIQRSNGNPTSSAGPNAMPGQSGSSTGGGGGGGGGGSQNANQGMASASSMSALAVIFAILAYLL